MLRSKASIQINVTNNQIDDTVIETMLSSLSLSLAKIHNEYKSYAQKLRVIESKQAQILVDLKKLDNETSAVCNSVEAIMIEIKLLAALIRKYNSSNDKNVNIRLAEVNAIKEKLGIVLNLRKEQVNKNLLTLSIDLNHQQILSNLTEIKNEVTNLGQSLPDNDLCRKSFELLENSTKKIESFVISEDEMLKLNRTMLENIPQYIRAQQNNFVAVYRKFKALEANIISPQIEEKQQPVQSQPPVIMSVNVQPAPSTSTRAVSSSSSMQQNGSPISLSAVPNPAVPGSSLNLTSSRHTMYGKNSLALRREQAIKSCHEQYLQREREKANKPKSKSWFCCGSAM